VLISNDKARPTPKDAHKLVDLLNSGYDFVGLYRMGFFGFKKNLIDKVGYFDEKFCDGGYEDNDFYIRLKANKCAVYISEEIEYKVGIESLWPQKISKEHFFDKYRFDHKRKLIITRFKIKSRSLDPHSNKSFFGWEHSKFSQIPLQTYSARFDLVIQNYRIVNTSQIFPIFLIKLFYSYRMLIKKVIPIDQRKYYSAQSL
jgi:hypothetical protein